MKRQCPIPTTPKRRCRPLRVERDDVLWFISNRTVEARFFLHPLLCSAGLPLCRKARRLAKSLERHTDSKLDKLITKANKTRGPFQPKLRLDEAKRLCKGLMGSILARAQIRYGVRIYGVTIMSNHLHLTVHTPHKNLAAFMNYVKARSAEAINFILGRSGPLWSRRYDAQAILDDDAALERLCYAKHNPVAAGLVRAPEQWPGLNLDYSTHEEATMTLSFEYLDKTAWHQAGRPDSLMPFFKQAQLKLSPLPAHEGLSPLQYEALLKSALADKEQPSHVMGLEAVLKQDVFSKPRQPKRSRRPYAFGHPERKAEHRAELFALHDVYSQCSELYQRGQRQCVFPDGTYLPPVGLAA